MDTLDENGDDFLDPNCFDPKLTRIPHLPSFCKLVIISVDQFYIHMPLNFRLNL